MRVMKFSKFIKHYILGESIKDIEMNRILDKMNKNMELTDREKRFRDLYSQLSDEDFKDYMYLSKNSAFDVLSKLLNNNKKVICDLHDRNGKFGLQVIDITNDFENETCIITMKGNEKHELHDRYLYNIIYNNIKDEYSLQEQDEYFEKIPVGKDEY
jgi:hypothetical protein